MIPSDHAPAPHSSTKIPPAWLTPALVLVAACWIFSAPMRHPNVPRMVWFQDDLFYYLKVAANLVAGHGSTFDGLHRTNGYHPLYFVLLTAFTRINPGFSFLSTCLCLLAVVATVVSFFAIRAILHACVPGDTILTDVMSLLALIPCLNTFYQGMETTLTLPLALLLLAWWLQALTQPISVSGALGGLLAALAVLSRLDCGFLVLLLVAATLASRKHLPPAVTALFLPFTVVFTVCLAPYFLLNRALFGAWLPISGIAKQLRRHHTPSAEVWRSVLHPTASQAALLLLSVAAILLFVRLRRSLASPIQIILVSAITFRWLHFLLLSFVSDWPLWGWYFYSVRFAVLAFFALTAIALSRTDFLRLRPALHTALLPLAILLLFLQHWVRDPGMQNIYATAESLATFSQTHPGLYAMGDRAGMVGYLLANPVLQTEGLVTDLAFINHIRHQDDLQLTLRHEGVRYYISATADPVSSGACLLASEPALAGPDSPRMRSRLCTPPVLVVPGEHTTRVFDLDSNAGACCAPPDGHP